MKKQADISFDRSMMLDPETTQEDAERNDMQLHGKKKKTLNELGFKAHATLKKVNLWQ